ncbi:hypothetical protein Leryth_020885 [Lithospermum erythrorhizon]|nr:hypothetical protein Leryth_020885 [Lithospermum erythrorhizon]
MLSNTWYHHGLQVELCDSELIDVYGSKLTCCSSNTGPLLDLGFRLTRSSLLSNTSCFGFASQKAPSRLSNHKEESCGDLSWATYAGCRSPHTASPQPPMLVAFNKKVYLVALN